MAKQMLHEKIENIAKSLNITKKDVRDIIEYYIWYRQCELQDGKTVQIVGIVDIIPEPQITVTSSTVAYVAREIAKMLKLPYNTVLFVIKHYLDNQYEQIEMGNSIVFRGLVRIKPIVSDGRITNIHSSISSSMTEMLRNKPNIESVRVHTSKAMKQKLYGSKVKPSKPNFWEEEIQ